MKVLFTGWFVCLFNLAVFSQKNDTLVIKANDSVSLSLHHNDSASRKLKDTVVKKKFDPGKASLYSAIFPGLGQIYNKKYWKVPIVWAAVGIPVYTFFFNRVYYNRSRYAIAVVANGSQGNADSMARVYPDYVAGVLAGDLQGLENIRNFYRENEDYSVLFFLLFYTLNIIDATVDAHLRDFNVSDDLSMKIRPGSIQGANWGAITLGFDLHKPKPKPLFDTR